MRTKQIGLVIKLGGALAGVVGLCGCQTHERQPLDLNAHVAAWRERSPASDEVAEFAQVIAAQRGDQSAAYDASDGISLSEAEIIALVFNADLRLVRLRAGIVAAHAEHAGLWDDPELGVGVERILESVSDPWVIASTVTITLPISGRLDAMKSLANSEYAAALHDVAVVEWELIRQVRIAWFEWSADQVRHDLAEASVTELTEIASVARKLKDAGEVDAVQATLFELELARRRNELRRINADLRESDLSLRILLGLSPGAPIQFTLQINFEARPDSMEIWSATIETTNLLLQQRRYEYESAERKLILEIRKQYPDLEIGPGYSNDEGQSRALLGLSIPLPILNANKQGIAEALAERDLARAAFETEYEKQVMQFNRAREQYDAAIEISDDLESSVIPMIDRQMNDARRLAELGEIDPLILLESLTRSYETKLAVIETRKAQSQAAALIDEILGPPASTKEIELAENPQ